MRVGTAQCSAARLQEGPGVLRGLGSLPKATPVHFLQPLSRPSCKLHPASCIMSCMMHANCILHPDPEHHSPRWCPTLPSGAGGGFPRDRKALGSSSDTARTSPEARATLCTAEYAMAARRPVPAGASAGRTGTGTTELMGLPTEQGAVRTAPREGQSLRANPPARDYVRYRALPFLKAMQTPPPCSWLFLQSTSSTRVLTSHPTLLSHLLIAMKSVLLLPPRSLASFLHLQP